MENTTVYYDDNGKPTHISHKTGNELYIFDIDENENVTIENTTIHHIDVYNKLKNN